MSVYVTGRQRTLSWSGSLSGTARWRFGPPFGGSPTIRGLWSAAQFSVSVCGCALSAGTTSLVPGTLSLQISASNGIDSDSDTGSISGTDATYDQGGSWSVTADVEECFEVLGLLPDIIDADGYPTFGGVAYRDGPIARHIRFFERLRVGGSIVATITSGALTATASTAITAGNSREAEYDLSLGLGGSTTNRDQTFALTGGSVSGGWGGGTYTRAESGSLWSATGTVDETADSLTLALGLTATPPTNPFDGTNAFGEVSGTCARPVAYRVSGRCLRWTDAYDGSLTAHIKTTPSTGVDVASDGSGVWGGYDVVHRSWSAASSLQGVAQTGAGAGGTLGSIRVYLTGASLTAMGDDAADWRLMIAGRPYPALTVSHAGTTALAPPIAAEGYRYLRVSHRSVGAAGQNWTLGIGGKAWTLTTGADGVWVQTDLDLCRPNGGGAQDDKESRYPLDGPGGRPVDSDYWGVSWIGAAPTQTKPAEVEVGAMNLVRLGSAARLSWVPAGTPWMPAWSSPTDETYHRPHGWSEVDGRIADIPASIRVEPISGVGAATTHQTIEQSRSRLAALGGWSAALAGSWPDAYHTGDRDTWWLGGGGHVWRGYPSGAWTPEIDRDVSGSTTVWAQALWDEATGYPGIGDAWERPDYPSLDAERALPIRFSKVLRGQAWGLALVDGATAELRRVSDGALRGSGAADARRFFRTGAPYGQPGVSHRVVVGSAETGGFTVRSRMRHRRVLGLVGGEVDCARCPVTGWVYAAHSISGRVDVVRWREPFIEGDEIRRTAAPDGLRGHIAVAPDGAVWVAYDRDGVVRARRSRSYGESWEGEMDIGSGTNAAPAACDRSGVLWVAGWRDDAYRLWRSENGGATWAAVGPPAGIAPGPEGRSGLVVAPEAGGRLMHWRDVGGTLKWRFSPDWGETWYDG